jgi:hypothetical protein
MSASGEPFIGLSDGAAMADDALLGLSVVGLGLIVWGVVSLVKLLSAKKATA